MKRILLLITVFITLHMGAAASNDRLQSSTANSMPFLMVLASDHTTGATGLTPTVTISKNGGSFASPSGAVTELANGWYLLAGNATDRATLGAFIIHATGTGADPADALFNITFSSPFAETLSDVSKWLGTAVATPATAGVPDVNVKNINNVAAATVGASGGIAAVGSNMGTVSTVTGNVNGNVGGSVGSVTGNVGGNVSGTVGSVTGNVGGNVVGSVASVTARVTANTDQWAGGTIPSPNVTGVPLVDNKYWIGTVLPSPDTAGYPKVTIKDGTGTGELDTSSGGVILTSGYQSTLVAAILAGVVDSTGPVDLKESLKRLMGAVVNTAPVTGSGDKTITLKAADNTTNIGTQIIDDAGAGRVTSIP